MLNRIHSWPEGHWGWQQEVTHKHGLRCGDMIFVGGQVDLDGSGRVRHPHDLGAQTDASMEYLRRVLAELGADTGDVVKLVCFYAHGDDGDWDRVIARMARTLGDGPGPVLSMVPLPALAYPGLVVEIEAIAMRGETGDRLPRRAAGHARSSYVPDPFSTALRCGEMVFTSGQSTARSDHSVGRRGDLVAQSALVMEQNAALLEELGAEIDDTVKINRYYVGEASAEAWQGSALACASGFREPGPAATGIPLPRLHRAGAMIQVELTAMRGADGARLPREHVWPQGHWDWPTHLPYKHGHRCGRMIYVGGQVSLAPDAAVIDPGDLPAQTRTSMKNIEKVLAGFGAGLDDVVKVTSFYTGQASSGRLHENFQIRSSCFTEPGPATTGVPLPALAYPEMDIEIEVIAMKEPG